MPISRKKLAARKRIRNQVHDAATGQFIEQHSASDDEYIWSSDNGYSTDSSDESYYNQKILKLGDISFVWTETDEKRKAPYLGNSTATYYRKHGPSGTYTKAAKGSLPITQYFTKQNLASAPPLSSSPNTSSFSPSFSTGYDGSGSNDAIGSDRDDDNRDGDNDYNILQPKLEDSKSTQEDETDIETDVEYDSIDETEIEYDSIGNDFDQRMKALEAVLSQNKKKITAYDYLKHRSIYEFFNNWKVKNMTCEVAAFNAAEKVYDKGVYCARAIRKWAKCWIENGTIPESLQGCHQKTKSFIDDEDVINNSLTFIRQNNGKITPKKYQQFINSVLFPKVEIMKTITLKTSRIWLKKIGLVPQSRKKGIYFDGHEREDVLEYRAKFLEEMKTFEQFMPTFVGNEMIQINPDISSNQQLHIFITHDECLFYANDDRPII